MLQEENFFESEKTIFTTLREAGFLPRTVLDIGASNGEWTEACLQIFPTAAYHLYEPLYSHLNHYKAGLDTLAAQNRNVQVHTVGLANRVGTADFYVASNFVGSSLLPLTLAQKIEIETTTLDKEFGNSDESIDIVKMDTQGGELLILQGARNVITRASIVLAECWLYPGYGPSTPLAHQIIEELSRYKFSVMGISAPYFDERHVLCALDICFAKSEILGLLGSHSISRLRDKRDERFR